MKIVKASAGPEKIKMKTRPGNAEASLLADWWNAEGDNELAAQLCSTTAYLKTAQNYRIRQLAVDIRLYCGLSIYSYAGSNTSKMDKTKALPEDRPTFNLVSVATDTLVSRIGQNEPTPKFLTDGGDYKERHLAQELNQFILGEFYQTHAYAKGKRMFRDGLVMGAGALKVYKGDDDKVCVDRVMTTDLYVDDNDALNGEPQQLVQVKLVNRERLAANNPQAFAEISETPNSYPDNSPDSARTTADQVMVVEGWKLASGPDKKAKGYVPGRHTIATQGGVIFDELYHKTKFPFVFFNYSDPFVGFWGQGLATRLFGTQLSLNRILHTITKAITLVGVPRVFIDQSSKVVKAQQNNEIGVLITYSGTKPSYEVAPCNAPELYAERDKLISYGLKQEGISDMQATGEKPRGLDSGEAMRTFEDVNDARFSETSKKYDQIFVDLAYLIVDTAREIAEKTGKYQTVYPNKDGTKQIDLPKMSILDDPFVIQCFSESSLPRSPAGRIAAITERVQAGMLTVKEGRRLMHYEDLEQDEKLDNASEERIFKYLDAIVESGEYTPPDIFLDLKLANELSVKYLNLYLACGLEEEKAELLRTFWKQTQTLAQLATPPPQPMPGAPMAGPEPVPASPLVPQQQQPLAS